MSRAARSLVKPGQAGGAALDTGLLSPRQAKLTVGASNDALELEADRVADQVLTGPAPVGISAARPHIQRLSGQPLGAAGAAPASVERAIAGPGQPLAPALQQDMGQRFGHDFSRVRVHTDVGAARSARELNARAYTVGRHIVFGADRFVPATRDGRRLLAHELTHVAQQSGLPRPQTVQRDLALEPKAAAPKIASLTAAQITAAISFNQARVSDADEVSLLRDILGLDPVPAVIDEAFIAMLIDYQARFGLAQDGKLGPKTVTQLSKEVIAEAKTLAPGKQGSLAPEFKLRDGLQLMIDSGQTAYADYKTRILAGTVFQRSVALLHEDLLTALRDALPWNDFARCVELLGRTALGHWELIAEPVVQAAIRGAWTDSQVAVPAAGTHQHEEGGWIFMNLITGALSARRAARGAGAAILLTGPPTVADSIVVAKFHTHPNLGPAWNPGPSDFPPAGPGLPRTGDVTVDAAHGVPDIIAGTAGIDAAHFDFIASGPNARAHLAGNRGLPGATGGLAPQGKRHDKSSPR